MQTEWNDNQPIYLQLREKVIALILDDVLLDGDPLPSVRNVSSDYRLNPITVSKAYQTLVDDQLVEKKRGIGMFIRSGTKELLLESEKKKFIEQEWPAIVSRMKRLGISRQELLSSDDTAFQKEASDE